MWHSTDSDMMTTENKTFRTKIAKLVKGVPQKSKRS